jgi:hypothetical protein
MSAFALGSVTRVNAEQIFFANGRFISVKDYRVDGEFITVTLRNGGEARFEKSLVAEIKADEMPPVEVAPRRSRHRARCTARSTRGRLRS